MADVARRWHGISVSVTSLVKSELALARLLFAFRSVATKAAHNNITPVVTLIVTHVALE